MALFLAEDYAGSWVVLEWSLLEHGSLVDTVAKGEQVSRLLCTDESEVAVRDSSMCVTSRIDGIRHDEGLGSRMSALTLTASDSPTARVAGFDEEADKYLAKRLDLGELFGGSGEVVRGIGFRVQRR